jgi:acetyl esterase/lipase
LVALATVAALPAGPVSATEVSKLLPADTDLIITVNVRQFLADHKQTEAVQQYLAALRQTAKENAQHFDLTQYIDRITFGFQSGHVESSVLIIEGKFQADKLRAAVKHLAAQQGGSLTVSKLEDVEVWQILIGTDGVHLALLNSKTLAITGSKKVMVDMLARTKNPINHALAASLKKLLEKAQDQHVAVMTNRVDLLGNEAVRIIQQGQGSDGDPKVGMTKLLLQQVTAAIEKHTKDIAAASAGVLVGTEGVELRLDLMATGPELAKKMRTAIGSGSALAGLALKAADNPLATQLAGILLKQRTHIDNATLTIQIDVPYQFLHQVVDGAGLPGLISANPESGKDGPVGLAKSSHALVERVTRQILSIPLWQLPNPQPPGSFPVLQVRDIAYRSGANVDGYRHRLDLFVPKGKRDFPVVVLVHGGGWVVGDNRCCGLYSSVGQFLATQGIGAVLPNYRLSPWVKHPEHVKDVARAVAWTHEHIGEYDGDPQHLFLLGHSAGGHLVSLLATDESYLKAEMLTIKDIHGVIGVSGVYQIPPGKVEVAFGGAGAKAAGPEHMLPLRGASSFPISRFLPPVSAAVDIYGPVFGDNVKDRIQASPLTHVCPGLPPFLIVIAEYDWPTLPLNADRFHQALKKQNCTSQLLTIAKRNHNSVLFSAIQPDDPAARAVLAFVRKK